MVVGSLVSRVGDVGPCAGEAVDASSSEPVAGAFDGDDFGVVNDAVDHRCGDDLVSEHGPPAGEWQVRGEHERSVFVAGSSLTRFRGHILCVDHAATRVVV